jgi:hypothetical protein
MMYVCVSESQRSMVQRSAYRRSSHRCKGAARHMYNIYGLEILLACPGGEEGVILLVHMKTTYVFRAGHHQVENGVTQRESGTLRSISYPAVFIYPWREPI